MYFGPLQMFKCSLGKDAGILEVRACLQTFTRVHTVRVGLTARLLWQGEQNQVALRFARLGRPISRSRGRGAWAWLASACCVLRKRGENSS